MNLTRIGCFFVKTIIEQFNEMKLVEFSCAAGGEIEYNADIHKYDADMHDGVSSWIVSFGKSVRN